MKNLYPLLICVCILSVSHFNAFAQNVNFPDPNLAAAVRSRLGLAADADITQAALQELTNLQVLSAEITDLTGLEYATGLTHLSLGRNQISNITPLSNLIGLTALILDRNQISDITPLSNLTNLTGLGLRANPIGDFRPLSNLTNLTKLNLIETTFSDSDITIFSSLTSLRGLHLSLNEISDLTSLATVLSGMNDLVGLHLDSNQISDLSPLGTLTHLTELETLNLNDNQINDISALGHFTSLKTLHLDNNQITDITPLRNLINLQWRLHIRNNQISDISPLRTLTKLVRLYMERNQVSDLSPLENLTELTTLEICYNPYTDISNPYTDISPLAALQNLTRLEIDEEFVKANTALVEATTNATLHLCPPLPVRLQTLLPEPETSSPEPEPAVKQRSSIARCGLGWAPHSQYQHHGELPKVMIYALEFEYDPEGHGRYICKTIEIRTGDDSIENLAGWNLYLGTLYNPSRIPLKIPEEHSQITDRILRITPEMLGLETFPCNTVNGISHPLPGVQYVLKTDENVLIDTAFSCFVWGQNAYITVNGKNVESPRRISSQALREMDTPRIERYITNPTGIFITDIPFEDFAWDRAVLSDWLLGLSEDTVAANPNAPFLPDKKLTTTWGAIKKQPILRQRNFKHKPAR